MAAKTGSPFFEDTPPPAGTAGRLWSPVPEHGAPMTYLNLRPSANTVNLSRWVFVNRVLDLNTLSPPPSLSGHKRWSLRAGHGSQDRCHS